MNEEKLVKTILCTAVTCRFNEQYENWSKAEKAYIGGNKKGFACNANSISLLISEPCPVCDYELDNICCSSYQR